MIQIRTLQKEDVEQAYKLEAENFSQPWLQSDFAEAVSNPKRIYLVAEEDGVIIGNCGLFQILSEGEISNVSVKKESRGKQIAFNMLQELFERAEKKGMNAFTLEVRESNLSAIKLYEKLGFRTEGIRKNFYSFPAENALIMWKR